MSMNGRIALLVAVLVVAAALTGLRPTLARLSAQDVTVERDSSGLTVRYRTAEGACVVQWIVTGSKGVIEHRPDCPGSFSRQLGPMSKLVARVFAEPGAAGTLQTVFIGGLTGLPELSARLASAATQSAGWDTAGGRPRSGLLNPFVATLLQDGRVLAQWQDVFATVQKQVRVSSVEQVQVSRAGDLPFYELLEKAGIPPSARVPYNGIVWLSLSPAIERSSPVN
jgi:hypothetical protein